MNSMKKEMEGKQTDTVVDSIPEIPASFGEKIEEVLDAQTENHKKKLHMPNVVTEWLQQYGKYAGAGLVTLALVIVCGISLAQRIAEGSVKTGVMMTVADIKQEKEAFEGNLFASTAITYNDMIHVNYETDQLAQLERAEKQIDEILSAKRQDKRDQAALEALTAVHSGPDEIGEYDPDAVVVASADTSVTTTTVPTASTYVAADANGQYQYLGEYLLTAYCPCPICCGKWSNMDNPITASGSPAVAGWTIAAPKEFPFGTKIMIDGQIYEVQDRGGAINGYHFDVYCNTHQEALNFNMRTTSAYLVVE